MNAAATLPRDDDEFTVQAPAKSSFFLGLRLLPAAQREAMYAIYAFCRAVDDIADGTGTHAERMAGLTRWRSAIRDLYEGRASHAGLQPLSSAIQRFGLARADFDAVIDGMAMDAAADIVAPDRRILDLYVDRVACAPGRLSVRVFGLGHQPGLDLAHHLGCALQLTNILRDVDEDATIGRLYIPREALALAGIAGLPMAALLADRRLSTACRTLALDAEEHFAAATRIMNMASRARVRAPRLMAAAYRPLLDRMIVRGWAPPRRKIAKNKLVLLGALLRYGLF